MTDRDEPTRTEQINHGRRDMLRAAAVLGVGTVAAPYLIRTANAQATDLGAYTAFLDLALGVANPAPGLVASA